MTLKGKPSSFISACNELSIFIFNHQDISVKLLVKSLLRREKERKIKGKPCNPTELLCSCQNIPTEPKLGVASTPCLGFHWGWLTSSSSQNLQLPSFSLFFTLPQSISKLYHLCSKTYFYYLFYFFIFTTDFLCWAPSLLSCRWSSFLTGLPLLTWAPSRAILHPVEKWSS